MVAYGGTSPVSCSPVSTKQPLAFPNTGVVNKFFAELFHDSKLDIKTSVKENSKREILFLHHKSTNKKYMLVSRPT